MSGSCGGQGGVPALQPGPPIKASALRNLDPLPDPLGLWGDTPSASSWSGGLAVRDRRLSQVSLAFFTLASQGVGRPARCDLRFPIFT